jgi:hypothetical protein
MVIRSAYQQLISSETAIEMCRMVFTDIYGAAEYDLQKPLRAEDGGNMWNVIGNHPERKGGMDRPVGERGRLKMSISKIDGAIVSFLV